MALAPGKSKNNIMRNRMRLLLLIGIAGFFISAVFVFDASANFFQKAFTEESGTPRNPIIDSDMTLEEALRKASPLEFKKRQKLVEVVYYSFDGKIHKGQLVIDEKLVEDIREVFRVMLKYKFPITSVIPISHNCFFRNGKWNEDDLSMAANNTSAFNYRLVTGGKSLSMHAYGFAIDINPLQNPYIKGGIVLPLGAVYDIHKQGTLANDSPIVKTFLRLGWIWGGNWESLKDYQHFEKFRKIYEIRR